MRHENVFFLALPFQSVSFVMWILRFRSCGGGVPKVRYEIVSSALPFQRIGFLTEIIRFHSGGGEGSEVEIRNGLLSVTVPLCQFRDADS